MYSFKKKVNYKAMKSKKFLYFKNKRLDSKDRLFLQNNLFKKKKNFYYKKTYKKIFK